MSRYYWISSLCILLLFAGCRAESSRTLPSAIPSAMVITSSATSTYTAIPTPTATILPTLTPTTTATATLIPSATPDLREFVVRSRRADVWNAPDNEGSYWDLQTQLILGEKVLVLEQRGDWSQIVAVEQPSTKDGRGYPGWVRSEALIQGWPSVERYAVIMVPYSILRSEPNGATQMSLYFDTRLPVETEEADWLEVRLPDGSSGWLPIIDVRVTDNLSAPIPTDGLFALAESLVGVPYWWGGASTDALDCSGLIYRVFHAYGITLARDADDQALGGELVDLNSLQKGDLVFTSNEGGGVVTHVSFYWGIGMILDSSGYRGVKLRPLPELLQDHIWVTARRYLP